jgi:hypothetical protein
MNQRRDSTLIEKDFLKADSSKRVHALRLGSLRRSAVVVTMQILCDASDQVDGVFR